MGTEVRRWGYFCPETKSSIPCTAIRKRPLRTLLCTSIPPLARQRRVSDGGRDISAEYARFCVATWVDSTDSVRSVNSYRECDLGIEDLKVNVLYCEHDFYESTGRPLIGLDDLLVQFEEDETFTHLVIVNADVYLDTARVLDQLRRMNKGFFISEPRVNTTTINFEPNSFYKHGFDLFVLTREQAAVLRGTQFAIGMPWWDHYIPVMLTLHGHRRLSSTGPSAFSLIHDERWVIDQWQHFGRLFVSEVLRRVSWGRMLRRSSRRYLVLLVANSTALALAGTLARLRSRVVDSIVTSALDRMSRENLSFTRTTYSP